MSYISSSLEGIFRKHHVQMQNYVFDYVYKE